ASPCPARRSASRCRRGGGRAAPCTRQRRRAGGLCGGASRPRKDAPPPPSRAPLTNAQSAGEAAAPGLAGIRARNPTALHSRRRRGRFRAWLPPGSANLGKARERGISVGRTKLRRAGTPLVACAPRARRRRGMTVLEVTIAIAIVAMILLGS